MDNEMKEKIIVEPKRIHDLLMTKLEAMPVVPLNEFAKRGLPNEFASMMEEHNIQLGSIIDWVDGTIFCTPRHDYWVDSMILNNEEYALYIVKMVEGDSSPQAQDHYGWLVCCTRSQKWEQIKETVNAVTKSGDKTRIWRTMNTTEIQKDHIIRKCPDGFIFKISRLVFTKELLMNLADEIGRMINDLERSSEEQYEEIQKYGQQLEELEHSFDNRVVLIKEFKKAFLRTGAANPDGQISPKVRNYCAEAAALGLFPFDSNADDATLKDQINQFMDIPVSN